MKKQSTYGAWVRPTVQWDIECEWAGISRQDGYEAFQTKFDDLGHAIEIRKAGYFFVVCMVTPFICMTWVCLVDPRAAAALLYGVFILFYFVSRSVFFFFFINLLTMTTEERDKIDANREDMQRVEILKTCADQYSHVDAERIRKEMHTAQKTLDEIYWGVLGMLCVICIEVFLLVPSARL